MVVAWTGENLLGEGDDLMQDAEGFANSLDVRAKEREIRMAPGLGFFF